MLDRQKVRQTKSLTSINEVGDLRKIAVILGKIGEKLMEKGKIVAIITGAISIFLAVTYLIIVQLLDFRGEMIPAPTSQLPLSGEVAQE